MPDFAEVQGAQRRAAAGRGVSVEELAHHRRIQGLVATRMETLLRDDEWGTFVAHVELIRRYDEQAVAALRQQQDDALLVGDDLARAHLKIQRLLGRLDAYRDALEIPQTVIARAEADAEAEKKRLDTTAHGESRT